MAQTGVAEFTALEKAAKIFRPYGAAVYLGSSIVYNVADYYKVQEVNRNKEV